MIFMILFSINPTEPKRVLQKVLVWGQPKIYFGTLFFSEYRLHTSHTLFQNDYNERDLRTQHTVIQYYLETCSFTESDMFYRLTCS